MPQSFVFAFTCPKRLKDDPAASLLPLGLLSMAAHLKRAGHQAVAVHLGRMSRRDAIEVLVDGDPSVVGFTCFTFQRARTLEMARLLRERCGPERPRILLGGPHAGPLAREILERCPWIDGDADSSLLAAVKNSPELNRLQGLAAPAHVIEVLGRALQPSPAHRFPSAEAMATSVRSVLSGSDLKGTRESLARRMWRLFQ